MFEVIIMSLRVQAASPNHESRPLPRESKKIGFVERLASGGISFRCRHSHNSNDSNHNHQEYSVNRTRNDSDTSMATASTINSADDYISAASASSPHKKQHFKSIALSNDRSSTKRKVVCREGHNVSFPSSKASTYPSNVMRWMQNDCPKDVVPLILAFAGPQKIATIGKINRFWRQVIEQEATWRRLCEALYKWREGDDIPESWKKYYQYNPCVPVDYFDIHTALSEAIRNAKEDSSKPREIRVLLRPGRYVLRKAITVDESSDSDDRNGDNNHSFAVAVAVETMVYVPEDCIYGDTGYHSLQPHSPPDQSKRKLKDSIKNIFRCRTVDVESEDEEDFVDHESLIENYVESPSVPLEDSIGNSNSVAREDRLFESTSGIHGTNRARANSNDSHGVKRATLVLTTRRHNEPLLRIRQGSFTIRNIDLKHGSLGNDIWNGNSAIQIQPTLGIDNNPFRTPAPTVTLDGVGVTSSSGRGVVNIDGGHLKISNSYIHDCAATGIYVGGSGSRATIEQSDVIHNGKGNTRNRRGIAAGHSGIYLEQGHASIVDCNISRNTLTGISAISPDNALLSLQESDLVSNGTFQLEMPEVGSTAHRNSVTVNNNLASSGRGRFRSAFLVE